MSLEFGGIHIVRRVFVPKSMLEEADFLEKEFEATTRRRYDPRERIKSPFLQPVDKSVLLTLFCQLFSFVCLLSQSHHSKTPAGMPLPESPLLEPL